MRGEHIEYEGPAVVEIMGHHRMAGFVRVVDLAGPKLRVDVPAVDDHPASTHYWAPDSIFGVHPTSEALVLRLARIYRYEPASKWDLEEVTPTVDLRKPTLSPVLGDDDDIPFEDR